MPGGPPIYCFEVEPLGVVLVELVARRNVRVYYASSTETG